MGSTHMGRLSLRLSQSPAHNLNATFNTSPTNARIDLVQKGEPTMTTKREHSIQQSMSDFGMTEEEAERFEDECDYAEPMRKGELYASFGGREDTP